MSEQQVKQKICIIEDDPAIREIYKTKLLEEGYDVKTANDGMEGYDLISKEKPDLALIDIQMPNIDGVELMEMLNKDEELSKIPVVVLTNYDDNGLIARTRNLGAKSYLVKAFYAPTGVARFVKEALD